MTTPEMALLMTPLPPPAAPFLDTSDERLLELDALADKNRFDLAAEGVENLIREGIFDIRPLPYYLYNAFATGSTSALEEILKAVENLIGPSLPSMGPSARREAYVNKRLHWLFEKVAASLAYQQKTKSERWRHWTNPEQAEVFDRILAIGARLVKVLEAPPYPDAHSSLAQVLAIVRGVKEQAGEGVQSGAPASSAAPSTRPPAPGNDPPAAQPRSQAPSATEPSSVELLAAAPFLDLCQRLAAFEELVRSEQLEKAAVVAADIEERIAQFDPRIHFPGLFATFVALQSKHVTSFTRYAETTPQHVWRALRQFYLVDLRGFTES